MRSQRVAKRSSGQADGKFLPLVRHVASNHRKASFIQTEHHSHDALGGLGQVAHHAATGRHEVGEVLHCIVFGRVAELSRSAVNMYEGILAPTP